MNETVSAVQAVAANAGTTFGDLFFGTYESPWALVGVALLSALAGMVSHWIKKFYTEYETESFFDWFFVKNKRGTVLAIIGMLGALFAAFAPIDYTTISSYQVFTQAWAVGYAADSIFNSTGSAGFRTRATMQKERESELPVNEGNPAQHLPGGENPGPNNGP